MALFWLRGRLLKLIALLRTREAGFAKSVIEFLVDMSWTYDEVLAKFDEPVPYAPHDDYSNAIVNAGAVQSIIWYICH